MGIAPLSAWGATSLNRLGKALTVPAFLTGITLFVIIIGGVRSVVALIGYGSMLLAGFVAIYETYRGAAARRRGLGESWWGAIIALFGRNQRRYGGYLVHLGVTVIGIGVIASTLFQVETQQPLQIGESMIIDDYEMRFDSFQGGQIAEDGRIMHIANVTVLRNGNPIAQLRPRIDDFPDQPMTIAGAHSTLENDFYVLLTRTNNDNVTFKVYINPLVNLVWWGGIILMIGTFIAAWPKDSSTVSRQNRKSGAPS